MSTLVTRAGKGSPLTHNEVDANFNNLNTDKIQSGNTVAALTITSATVTDLAVTGITSFDGAQGTAGQVLTSAGTGNTPTWATPASSGVTSVTGTSPVASSGGTTPAISLATNYGDTQNPYASKTANFVLAAPNGSAGAPTFRAVVAADIPTLNQNTTGSAATVTGATQASITSAANLATVGTITSGTWSASFGAVSGANLTTLNASNLSSGTVATARLATGTASVSTFLRGDSTWAAVSASPAGSNTQIQYNSSGSFAGSSNLTFDGTNLSFNSGYGSAAVAYGCRAWVNFQGTNTVSIRASGNVSSITDGGTGIYTVNFTTAIVDTNYAVLGTCERDGTSNFDNPLLSHRTRATGSVVINTSRAGTDLFDMLAPTIAIIR
jgi:hypothetical protein